MARTLSERARRRRIRIVRDGWIAIALTGWLLAVTLMSRASLMLLVFSLLVAALVLAAVQTLSNLRRLDAEVRLPEHAVAGRPFRLECRVWNRRQFGAARGVVLSCKVPRSSQSIRMFLPAVPARSQVKEHTTLTLPNRGLYRLGELNLSTQFPFGLLEDSRQTGQPQQLLVYPRLGKLRRRFFQVERQEPFDEQGRRPSHSSIEADYHGLREFRDGDSPHWIHWPTSARQGKLMIKEFETRQNRNVAVLLDPWIPARPEPYHVGLLELAISFAATLCVDLCRRQRLHVVFGVASDPPVVRHGLSSQRLLQELLEQLALLEGTSDPPWEPLVELLPLKWTGNFRVTAISTRPPDLPSLPRFTEEGFWRRWRRLNRRLLELDVGSSQMHEYFELS